MFICFENIKNELGGICRIEIDLYTDKYLLKKLSRELLQAMSDINLSNRKVDVEVTKEEKLVLEGEDCLFSDIDPIAKTAILIVSWVEEDNVV